MLHYTTLHYTTLYYTMLHYTILHYTTLCYTMLHYTILHYTTLCYTILSHAAPCTRSWTLCTPSCPLHSRDLSCARVSPQMQAELGGNEAMTCQELLALSGALSAALPTGQLALDSFLNSLTKGTISSFSNFSSFLFNREWEFWQCSGDFNINIMYCITGILYIVIMYKYVMIMCHNW